MFSYCYNLSDVDLQDCEYLAGYTFVSCTSLTSISLPKVTSTGNGAFAYCNKLSSIYLPLCSFIGDSAFRSCYSLASVSLPIATHIGNYAFSNCGTISYIDLPECTYLGPFAFQGCGKLLSMSIPKVSTLYYGMFYGCGSLLYLDLTQFTNLGSHSSSGMYNLFANCYSLSLIDFPLFSLMTELPASIFSGCSNLTLSSLNLLSYSKICEYALAGCNVIASSITSLDLPNLEYLGSFAFSCNSSQYHISHVSFPRLKVLGGPITSGQ